MDIAAKRREIAWHVVTLGVGLVVWLVCFELSPR
jgi:hypothetical protein